MSDDRKRPSSSTSPPRKRRSSTTPQFILDLSANASPTSSCVVVCHTQLYVRTSNASPRRSSPRAGASFKVKLTADPILGFGVITNVHGRVTTVVAGTPAERAGIAPFDRIIGVNGSAIDSDRAPLETLVKACKSIEAQLTIERPPASLRNDIAEHENQEGSSPYQIRPASMLGSMSSPRPKAKSATAKKNAKKDVGKEHSKASHAEAETRRVIVRRSPGESLGIVVTWRRSSSCGDSAPCCTITAIVPGSPAQRAGLQVGDAVASVDGKELKGTLTELLLRPKMRNQPAFVFNVRRPLPTGAVSGDGKVSVSDVRMPMLTANL